MPDPVVGNYGDQHVRVYDRLYGARFTPDAAVAALVAAAGPDGRLLEMGMGTGRLAVPLAERGLQVDGIEASTAMITQFRDQRDNPPGIVVFHADLADFDLPRKDYAVAVCAVSTMFKLPGPVDQASCLASVSRHLRPGGRLFVEAFRPDPTRFDDSGNRIEERDDVEGRHIVRSHHDPHEHSIHIVHELEGESGWDSYEVVLHYLTPEELDDLASAAGLDRVGRWHDWTGAPATSGRSDPVSVYAPAGEADL